jgi:hypothetical protein
VVFALRYPVENLSQDHCALFSTEVSPDSIAVIEIPGVEFCNLSSSGI